MFVFHSPDLACEPLTSVRRADWLSVLSVLGWALASPWMGCGLASGRGSEACGCGHRPHEGRFLVGTDALTVVVAALGHVRRQELARAFAQERAFYAVTDPALAALYRGLEILLQDAADDEHDGELGN
jgi:hypothetical protein